MSTSWLLPNPTLIWHGTMFNNLQTCNDFDDCIVSLHAMCERHVETMHLSPKHLSFHKITQLNVTQILMFECLNMN